MELETLKNDIDVTLDDIKSLEGEIGRLLEEKTRLDRLIQRSKQDAIKDLDSQVKRTINEEEVTKRSFDHQYFDDSIVQYFQNGELNNMNNISKSIPSKEPNPNLLLENVYRFSGITFFPLNEHLLDNEALGIRFDVFTHRQFQTPHYVILMKHQAKSGNMEWKIHKHTIPVYVPLNEYSKYLHDIPKFVSCIRTFLINIQYKHDKFSQLRLLGWKVTTDLMCERVVLDKNGVQINIVCGLDEIESSECLGTDKFKKEYIEGRLWRCHSRDLIKTLRKINV